MLIDSGEISVGVKAYLIPERKDYPTVTKEISESYDVDIDTANAEQDFFTSISEEPREPLAISKRKDSPRTTKEIKDTEVTKQTVTEKISKSQVAGIETAKAAIKEFFTTSSEEPSEGFVVPERKDTKDIDFIKGIVTEEFPTSQDTGIETAKVAIKDLLKEPTEHLLIPEREDSKDIKVTKETATKDIVKLQDAYLEDAKQKPKYKSHYAADEWNYTMLSHKVDATEKGLYKVNYFSLLFKTEYMSYQVSATF